MVINFSEIKYSINIAKTFRNFCILAKIYYYLLSKIGTYD